MVKYVWRTEHLFDPIDSVLFQKPVGADNRDLECKGLRYKKPIKRIAMMKRQKSGSSGMLNCDRQFRE